MWGSQWQDASCQWSVSTPERFLPIALLCHPPEIVDFRDLQTIDYTPGCTVTIKVAWCPLRVLHRKLQVFFHRGCNWYFLWSVASADFKSLRWYWMLSWTFKIHSSTCWPGLAVRPPAAKLGDEDSFLPRTSPISCVQGCLNSVSWESEGQQPGQAYACDLHILWDLQDKTP